MKYLISSDGISVSSPVSSHFGKAPYFLIYDDENESTAAIANGDGVDPHLVIRDSAKAGVVKMICGGIGPYAFQVAEKFKVEVNIAPGIPVAEAVRLAAEGKLPVTTEPTAHHSHHDHEHHKSNFEL